MPEIVKVCFYFDNGKRVCYDNPIIEYYNSKDIHQYDLKKGVIKNVTEYELSFLAPSDKGAKVQDIPGGNLNGSKRIK